MDAATSPAPVIVAILAAGSGTRMAGSAPKQLAELAGRPVLAHSLRAFEEASCVNEIIIVTREDIMEPIRDVVAAAQLSKPTRAVIGGATRSASSRAAINAIEAPPDAKVLIHDAARPLVDQATIAAVVRGLDHADAVAPVVDVADTIVVVMGDRVQDVPARNGLRRMQTPQGFRYAVLHDAYAQAAADEGFAATDDCGVVHRYRPDVVIRVVAGSPENIKITRAEDLARAELLLDRRRREPTDQKSRSVEGSMPSNRS